MCVYACVCVCAFLSAPANATTPVRLTNVSKTRNQRQWRASQERWQALPEGRQHAVVEVPGGRQVRVLSVGRVETPRGLVHTC